MSALIGKDRQAHTWREEKVWIRPFFQLLLYLVEDR